MSTPPNSIPPNGYQNFDLFDLNASTQREANETNSVSHQRQSTDAKIKRLRLTDLDIQQPKKQKKAHPLAFLLGEKLQDNFTADEDLEAFIADEELSLDLDEDSRDKKFICTFKQGAAPYLENFTLENRIYFFKALKDFAHKNPALTAEDVQIFCKLLSPFGTWGEYRAFEATVNLFIDYDPKDWKAFIEILPILLNKNSSCRWLLSFFKSLEEIHPHQWLEFSYFYIDFSHECQKAIPTFIPFFNTFNRQELTKLLTGTNPEIRRFFFQEEYTPFERVGIEILTRMPTEYLLKYYAMIRNIDPKYTQFVLYLPQILKLDKEGGRENSFEFLTYLLQSGFISFENLDFTISRGAELQVFHLNNLKVLLSISDLQENWFEYHALLEFLRNSFEAEENPIIKRILAEDLIKLMFSMAESSSEDYLEARDSIILLWDKIRNYLETVNFNNKNIPQDSPLFQLLELNKMSIGSSGNTLFLKEGLKPADYPSILQILANSQIERTLKFDVIFLKSAPEIIDGKLQYKAPPYLDLGGPTRTLFQKIATGIVKNEEGQGIELDSEGFAILKEDAPVSKFTIFKNFGSFLSMTKKLGVPLGKIFDKKAFLLMRILKMSSDQESLCFFQQVDRSLFGERLLNKSPLNSQDLEEIKKLYLLDTIEEIPTVLHQELKRIYSDRIRALNTILLGFDLATHFELRQQSPSSFRYQIEGESLNKENFSKFISVFVDEYENTSLDPDLLSMEKIKECITDWLLAASREKLEKFTLAVTGSSAIDFSEKIKIIIRPKVKNTINPNIACFIHTCSNEIEIFADTSQEIFEEFEGICLETKFNAV